MRSLLWIWQCVLLLSTIVSGKAGFDQSLRDRILSVFSGASEGPSSDYATTLKSLATAIIERTNPRAKGSEGAALDELLQEVENLISVLAEQLATDA